MALDVSKVRCAVIFRNKQYKKTRFTIFFSESREQQTAKHGVISQRIGILCENLKYFNVRVKYIAENLMFMGPCIIFIVA